MKIDLIECDNESAQAGLLNGDFDLIIFVTENSDSGIPCKPLLRAPPYLLISQQHRLADQKAVSFRDLNKEQLILLNLPFTRQYLQSLIKVFSLETNIVSTASSSEMVRSMVGANVGVSILNMRPLTASSYAGDGVLALPFEEDAPALHLALGQLAGSQRRMVTIFADACETYFRSNAALDLIVDANNGLKQNKLTERHSARM